jgi:hypothetical protein
MWKEAVMAKRKALSRHFFGRTEEKREESQNDGVYNTWDSKTTPRGSSHKFHGPVQLAGYEVICCASSTHNGPGT